MTRYSSGPPGPGAALLAALDRALPVDGVPYRPGGGEVDRRPEGLAAAVALDALLAHNRLGWPDVLAPGHQLAKICGLLGSNFVAENEAAYTHALRVIARDRSTWSALVRLPPGLTVRPDDGWTDPAAPADAAMPVPTAEAIFPATAATAATTPPAPETDWPTTILLLKARMAWRSAAERALLDELDARLGDGQPIATADARRLRDMWWFAELNDPVSEERPE